MSSIVQWKVMVYTSFEHSQLSKSPCIFSNHEAHPSLINLPKSSSLLGHNTDSAKWAKAPIQRSPTTDRHGDDDQAR